VYNSPARLLNNDAQRAMLSVVQFCSTLDLPMRPTDVLLDHLEDLRQAFAGGVPPSRAWPRMPETITHAMILNTFKTLAPTIIATAERLSTIEQPLNASVEQELVQLHEQLRTVEQERDALRQRLSTVEQPPNHFDRWRVRRDKRGYLQLARRVDGKVRVLHTSAGSGTRSRRESGSIGSCRGGV